MLLLATGIVGAALAGLAPALAAPPPLGQPQGRPILRIGGKITVHNAGDEAVFDVAMLDAIGRRTFSTSTPWTNGVHTWEGVPLAALMQAVGAYGTQIRAIALNDYVADIPMAGIADEGGILAIRRDGKLMPISDKGPLFVLYPFDQDVRLQQQSVFMRCAWQVARLVVL
ncbi:oxidoreductase [Jiella sp. M17.18]|uniref:oxidoreductase n=1 Tax=Jiella sp. M17.18 TaxID=3234247 RepID=UPI0034DF3B94